MPVTAKSFLISLAIDVAVGVLCFIALCILRRWKPWRHFYAPKRFLSNINRPRAPGWGRGISGPFNVSWVGIVYRYTEDEVLAVAGWDSVVYLRILRFGSILFTFLTFWCWAVVLPTNIAGGNYINQLKASPIPTTSQFTYWIPPSPLLALGASPESPASPVPVPKFYNANIPPAPAGLTWMEYNPGVPVLPPVSSLLGQNFSSYIWEYTTQTSPPNSFTFTDLDKASIANIAPGSSLLAIHVLSAWVMSLFTWALLWSYAKKSVALRVEYFLTLPKGVDSHTVLVQDIPGVAFGTIVQRVESAAPKCIADKVHKGVIKSANHVGTTAKSTATSCIPCLNSGEQDSSPTKSDVAADFTLQDTDMFSSWGKAEKILQNKTMAQMVHEEFAELFPGQVTGVATVHDTSKLEGLAACYKTNNLKLWDLIGDYSSKKRSGKKVKRSQIRVVGALLGEWGKEKYGMKPVKKDALEYLPEYLDHQRELIHEEQGKALQTDAPVAFVTFRTRRAASVASSIMINHDLSIYNTSPAPPPETIFWGNLRWRQWERSGRNNLIWVAFWTLATFYLIPIGAVQALVNVQLLSKIPPFKELLKIPITNAIIVSILPGLILKAFLAVLPALLTFMNKRAGMQSKAEIDFGVFQKYFIFQVITVFFGSFIVGSFFSQYHQWLNNPSSAVSLMGTAVPQTASFFLTYMAVLAFLTVPFGGLRIVGLLLFWIKCKIAATERARARLWQDQFAQYGADVANHTLSILLGLVYCIIQPVMAPLVLCYFLISLFYAKYDAIYVLRPAYESGGKMWPVVHGQVIVGLILAQVVLTFVFAIKKLVWAAIITAITILASIIFHLAVKKRFFPPQLQMSYRGATDGDFADGAKGDVAEDFEEPLVEHYLNPAFKFDEEDHAAVLREAQNVDLVLRGERGDDALIALAPEYDEEEAGLVTVGTGNASKPSRFTNLFKGPDNDTSAIKAVQL